MTIKVHVSNLAAYTRGELKGEWLKLPMTEEVLRKAIADILDTPHKDEECFITDYESPFSIKEHENIFALNELAEELEGINEDEDIVGLIADDILGSGYERSELVRILTDHEYTIINNVRDEQDLALKADVELLPFNYELIKDTNIADYLDWEAIGNSMVLDGWTITGGYGIKVYV
jgi:hypothetical protein